MSTPIRLHCIGVRFRDVDARVVESVALDRSGVLAAHDRLARHLDGAEAIVLATCNRTELYIAEAGDDEAVQLWHRALGDETLERCPASAHDRFHLVGDDAIEHLLRVASGLDSDQLGDAEIIGQLRDARQVAHDAGNVGPVLHHVFDTAFRTGRRVRSETGLGSGGSSVGAATAAVVGGLLLDRPRAVVIGAGHAGESVCRALVRSGAHVEVHSRSATRASEVAGATGALVCEDLAASLPLADVVVSAVEPGRRAIDHRSVDPGRIGHLRGIDLSPVGSLDPAWFPVVPLHEIQQRSHRILARRHAAVPPAEAIVRREGAELSQWFRTRALDALVAALFAEADAAAAEAAADAPPDERREIRRRIRSEAHQRAQLLRAGGRATPTEARTR